MRLNKESNFPNGFKNGITLEGLAQVITYANNVFYVDSNTGSNGNPGTKQKPFATLNYAKGKCTANKGDVIILKDGHAEPVTTAGGVDLDVAGIKVIGLGSGDLIPTFTFTTSAGADIDIDAADIVVKNIKLKCNIDAQTHMLDVNSDDFTAEGIVMEATSSAQPKSMIDVAGDNFKLENSIIESLTAGTSAAIFISSSGANRPIIQNNYIYGDWGKGGLYSTKVFADALIKENVVKNTKAGVGAIVFTGAATGELIDNRLIADTTNVFTTLLDPGSLYCIGNMAVDSIDTAGTPIPILTEEEGLIGGNNSNNAVSTANVTANEDGSIVERLEQIQEAVNVGTGTSLRANWSLVDDLAGASMCYNRSKGFTSREIDFSSASWNTVGNHTLFTTCAGVRVRMAIFCTSGITGGSSSYIKLGTDVDTAAFIAATSAGAIDNEEIWNSTSPSKQPDTSNAVIDFVGYNRNIVFAITNNDLTAGKLLFSVWYEPITAGGSLSAYNP